MGKLAKERTYTIYYYNSKRRRRKRKRKKKEKGEDKEGTSWGYNNN